jgi:hypothetical protein
LGLASGRVEDGRGSLGPVANAPFPIPAHRTGRADLPHPALGQDFTPLLSRATPSAVSDHFRSLLGCPISRSITTYCVCPELRPLPSTGITRLQRYYEPLRHPSAPGLALAGFQLVVAPTTPWGFPCCVRFPCVHAVATTPAQRLGALVCSFIPAVSAFPERVVGSACALSFSRIAQRSLALRPAHSRCHLIVTRIPKASASSLPPWLLRLLPAGAFCRVGFTPTGKRRLLTAHTHCGLAA